jgi:DNA polymerase-3 subunit epsilon
MTQQHPTGKPAQFDMFIDPANGQEGSGYSPSLVRRVKSHPMQEAEMLAHLAATGRFRILRKLEPRQVQVAFDPNTLSMASSSTRKPPVSIIAKPRLSRLA